jgi:HK97 family phage portal protein
MGILARAVAPQRKAAAFQESFWPELIGAKSKAGPNVTLDTAFKVSAFFACIRAISQGCTIPFKLMQETGEGEKKKRRVAREHPAFDLVTSQPNGWQTGFEFMETFVLHASLGNGYAFKNVVRGTPRELIVLDPSRVQAELSEEYKPIYRVTGRDGEQKTIDASMIWHLRGPSWDGFLGLEVLKLAREALGLSVALEESVSSLHANGVRPSGVYSVESTLDEKQYKQLTDWLKKQAAAGTGTPLVLDRGAKWLSQTMTSADAQTREMRQTQIEEVCRFVGVLPIVIGFSGDKANTYASAEAMFTHHRVFGMDPWYRRIQASADVNLLTKEERKAGFYWKFVVNALLHAVAKDQADYFSKALGAGGAPGWMTQDQVRDLLDMDPMGGDAGKLPVATNVPAAPGTKDTDDAAGQPPGQNQRLNVGRVLSARNERRIRDAQTNLTDVLAELGETEEE